MTRKSLSVLEAPSASTSVGLPTKAQMDAGAGGPVTLGELYKPMTGVWPAVDSVNGPLTADAGITNTAPSFTGLTYFAWNATNYSGKSYFNQQSQNWVAVPSSNGPAANQCCQNTTTNRGNYGSTGIGFPSHTDFSFSADTAKVIIVYWQCLTSMSGVSTSYHENQIFVEYEGQMKAIREFPASWPGGSGGGTLFYRVLTFSKAKRRRFRVWLSSNCWFAGIYVDTAANVQPSHNLPLVMSFGDSWAEPDGNVFASVGGNGSVAGVTWPSSCSLLYSNVDLQFALATGFAVALCHHGGTGWVVNNGGISATASGTGFSPFLSNSQWGYSYGIWGSKYPIVFVAGGWNDGTSSVSAPVLTNYQAVVQAGFNRVIASDPLMPILAAGIQDKSVVSGDGRDLSNQGIAAACAATPQCIGFIDQLHNWPLATGIDASDIGPDGLHPTLKGGDEIGANYAKKAAQFTIPRYRLNQMLTAA
jgi:hypothetical protein